MVTNWTLMSVFETAARLRETEAQPVFR